MTRREAGLHSVLQGWQQCYMMIRSVRLELSNPAVGLSALIELVRYGILLVLFFPCLERSLEVLARLGNDLRRGIEHETTQIGLPTLFTTTIHNVDYCL